jgi:hypothetical protein
MKLQMLGSNRDLVNCQVPFAFPFEILSTDTNAQYFCLLAKP